ncbi:type I glutamate--ammonia ligase, partial [bacterium]|nr:type I glutamate--ammonia ligase [bacterium]
SCNPYMALAVILGAIIDGVENHVEPPLQVEENIYGMTPKELNRAHIESLPSSLDEALDLLEKNETIKEALGEHILNEFITTKRKECDTFRTYITPLETELYLGM